MNSRLLALYEEERADTRAFRGEEAMLAAQARLRRVEAAFHAGELETGEDYYHACFVYQHGDRLAHYATAHLLARRAFELGYEQAGYMVAAGYDRWLMRQGKPQRYGTQSLAGASGGHSEMWSTDPATTDEERAALGVPPLAELRSRPVTLPPSAPDAPFLKVTLAGAEIDLFDADGRDPMAGLPRWSTPVYEPPAPWDPEPEYLPSDVATVWRFGNLLCGKDSSDYPVCSWHLCRWQVVGGSAVSPEALFREIGRGVQWMSPEGAFWSRLSLPTGPSSCWIVGGQYSRAQLERIALSLPNSDN